MKIYTISPNRREGLYFLKYARALGAKLPPESDLLVAMDDGGAVRGFLACESESGFVEILFLIVLPDFRRNGYGAFLLNGLADIVSGTGVELIRCALPGDNTFPALFRKEGFEIFPGEKEYYFPYGVLRYSERYRKRIAGREARNVKRLEELNMDEEAMVRRFFEKNGLFWDGGYNSAISTAVIENGRLASLLLCGGGREDISIAYLYVKRGGSPYLLENFRALDGIISEKGKAADDIIISFSAGGDNSLRLCRLLVGDTVQMQERWQELIAIRRVPKG